MAVNSYDATTGHPIFDDSDAPDIKVDPTKVAEYAAEVGTRLIGSTAERTGYSYAREGLRWYDTDESAEFLYDGSGWKLWHKHTASYTPTTSNVSGSPTTAARYSIAEGVVHVEIEVSLNGANFGSAPSWSLPVNAASGTTMIVGTCWMFDTSGSAQAPGFARIASNVVIPYPINASGTFATLSTAVAATAPFTWASGDVLTLAFTYTAA